MIYYIGLIAMLLIITVAILWRIGDRRWEELTPDEQHERERDDAW